MCLNVDFLTLNKLADIEVNPVNQTNSNMKDKFQRADSNIIGYARDNFTNRDHMTLHPKSFDTGSLPYKDWNVYLNR